MISASNRTAHGIIAGRCDAMVDVGMLAEVDACTVDVVSLSKSSIRVTVICGESSRASNGDGTVI